MPKTTNTATFDQDAFKQEVKSWLTSPAKDLTRFNRFLAIISLINLARLANKNLTSVWHQDSLKHSYHLYRVPIAIYADTTMDIFGVAMNAAAADYGDAGYSAAHSAGCAYATDAYTTNPAFSAFSDHEATYATAAAETAYVAVYSTAVAVQIHALWQSVVLAETNLAQVNEQHLLLKNLYPKVVEGLTPLLSEDVGLDFLYKDLIALSQHLFLGTTNTLSKQRMQAYAHTLDNSAFANAQLLKDTIFADVFYPNFIRALLVGNGGSGKTTLFQLLTNQAVAKNTSATIAANHQHISNFNNLDGIDYDIEDSLDVELWDFAGQTQYYGLHQAFFNNNCYFILVVDSRHQQTPYGWLHQIQSYASTVKIPVIIVVNQYDNCPSQLNLHDIRHSFSQLHIHCVELDLSQYQGKSLSQLDLQPSDATLDISTEHQQVNELITQICTIESGLKKRMSKQLYELQTLLRKTLETQHIITDDELQDMVAKKDLGKIADFNEWIRSFGLLVPLELPFNTLWLDSNWFSEKSYQLLSKLQSNKQFAGRYAYSLTEIKQVLYSQESANHNGEPADAEPSQQPIDHAMTVHILSKLATPELSLAIQTKDKKVIFPAISPNDDPAFLTNLRRDYLLYGRFNIHIEFMQMGLFSQWIAKWLNKTHIKPSNFSRYCCILSSNHQTHEVHIAIRWQPHYGLLSFNFYQPQDVNEDTNADANIYIDAFTQLLEAALETIRLDMSKVQSDGQLLGSKPTIEKAYIQKLLAAIPKMKDGGIMRMYVEEMTNYTIKAKELTMGNKVSVVTGNNSQVSNTVGKNNTVTQTVNINQNQQNNHYIQALDKLADKFYADHDPELPANKTKVESFTKVMDVVKTNVTNGELTEPQKSILDQLVEGMESANTIYAYLAILLTSFAAVLPDGLTLIENILN